MAEAGTLCVNADVLRKAGLGANSTATAEAYTNVFIVDAEGYVNAATRYNWNDAYAGLNADFKSILREAVSNLAAIYCISYDMTGYASREDAETKIDVLHTRALECIDVLKDKLVQTFMGCT